MCRPHRCSDPPPALVAHLTSGILPPIIFRTSIMKIISSRISRQPTSRSGRHGARPASAWAASPTPDIDDLSGSFTTSRCAAPPHPGILLIHAVCADTRLSRTAPSTHAIFDLRARSSRPSSACIDPLEIRLASSARPPCRSTGRISPIATPISLKPVPKHARRSKTLCSCHPATIFSKILSTSARYALAVVLRLADT